MIAVSMHLVYSSSSHVRLFLSLSFFCKDKEYTKCTETEIIKVKGGFFTFSKQLKYLGSYIPYSFRDDCDIDACLEARNTSMGALGKFCVSTIAASILSPSPFPSIYYYEDVRSGHSGDSSFLNLRYSYTAASDAYYSSVWMR